MKKLLIMVVALTLVSFAAMAVVAADNGPAEIKMPASMGEVSFDHAGHQARVTDCTTCHHQGEGSACKSCHGTTTGIPDTKSIFHTSCKGCHKEQNGPTKCKECHSGPKS